MDVRLGKLIDDEKNPKKDAIHVAIIPLIAGQELYRGHKIKLKFNTLDVALDAEYDDENAFGIVDPFLSDYYVPEGKKFYGLLFPGTVTGMRHEWQHPLFNQNQIKQDLNEHEAWIRDFCDRWNFDYDELISAATSENKDPYGRYVVARGRDLHYKDELGEDHDAFWEHLAGLTGKVYNKDHKDGMGWSCTC